MHNIYLNKAASKESWVNKAFRKGVSGAHGFMRGYGSLTSKFPWLEAAGLASIFGGSGYLISKKKTQGLIEKLLERVPPEKREEELRKLHEDGTVKKINRVAAVLGAGLGAAYPIAKNLDTGAGLSGAFKSIFDPQYKEKNRDRLHKKYKDRIHNFESKRLAMDPSRFYSSGR